MNFSIRKKLVCFPWKSTECGCHPPTSRAFLMCGWHCHREVIWRYQCGTSAQLPLPVSSRNGTLWPWITRTEKKASQGLVSQADDQRGHVGADGCSATKPRNGKLRSELIKCHWNFDPYEPSGQRGLEKAETLPFRVTDITAGRTTFTGGSGGSGVRADTLATHTVPSPCTQSKSVFRGMWFKGHIY